MPDAAAKATPPLAFITGASSGIGRALATAYLARGWRVALIGRRAGPMRALAARHAGADRCRIWLADVTDPPAIRDVAERCIAEWGLPEVVIANAGVSAGIDPADAGDVDVLARLLATNVTGVAASLQPFIEPMRARGHGRLVVVASVAGFRGLAGQAGYGASKAAAIRYAESLRADLRGSGVRVVSRCPGFIDTPMTRANPFPMPFLMSADAFARQALRAIDTGARNRVIPRPMAVLAWLMRVLPESWLHAALARQPRKPRGPGA